VTTETIVDHRYIPLERLPCSIPRGLDSPVGSALFIEVSDSKNRIRVFEASHTSVRAAFCYPNRNEEIEYSVGGKINPDG
jgi:hypothetical protein